MSTQELISLDSVPDITPIIAEETPISEDFTAARANITSLIDVANTAVSELALIASQSQNAKVYESLSTMLNTLLAANKELVTLHKTAKDARGKRDLFQDRTGTPGTVNNNLFVGSTAELLQFMKENNLNGLR